ncbi:hypothetical protein TBLA_0B01400 [Henningerozyma blattae CBS 6284]|uniref:Dolichyl-diphosphooligosaccharide--protein glycosyltransferase subunit OST2 n=1 Tax=Henningerozyma blattae (strain ATCC 34711 / CBS 6284 / DSM 70876 / NBRC 10599 / NRRL Y-10934 / UCD 77-7) TaxID=1071380 RepID=I2GXY1_HENB6|nr:hypothetical protein TBLA_0B01400 [Tetrapisispora blattae CBS 6284]CCH58983.1 hypothetical protein TBLA_0B01400 [Tetrapisispora blattae CBS 6284]
MAQKVKNSKTIPKSSNISSSTKSVSHTTNKTTHGIFQDFQDAFNATIQHYWKQHEQDKRLRLIDIMCIFMVVVAALQCIFMILIRDNFPFNAFLSGFIICVGQFVLLVSLRLQMVSDFEGISKNRAFGEFVIASLILHFISLHFIN